MLAVSRPNLATLELTLLGLLVSFNALSQTTVTSPREAPALTTEPAPTTEPQVRVAPQVARAPQNLTDVAPESNVISLADREGFRWKTRRGDFEFNPYTLVQTYVQGTYVDNSWLALTDEDNVRALGFGTNNAILGVAGKGFERVTFNLALNAACSGACLLNQAWMDLSVNRGLRLRVGKFKTPMHWATQVRLGQALFPRLPTSLTARVTLPFGLNSVTPSIGHGFDTGIMAHGFLWRTLEYQVGVFNGEGIAVNTPTSTLSDDHGTPGLLYAARLAYQPLGPMKPAESSHVESGEPRVILGASTSYNVEANGESSDDFRAGLEAALRYGRTFFSAESYLLRMAFVERQRGIASKTFIGGYVQGGVTVAHGFEPIFRIEAFDRNSTTNRGVLVLPSVGVNWYLSGQNVKLSGTYQTLFRARYRNETEAHQDDNAVYDHSGLVQLQFAL